MEKPIAPKPSDESFVKIDIEALVRKTQERKLV